MKCMIKVKLFPTFCNGSKDGDVMFYMYNLRKYKKQFCQ